MAAHATTPNKNGEEEESSPLLHNQEPLNEEVKKHDFPEEEKKNKKEPSLPTPPPPPPSLPPPCKPLHPLPEAAVDGYEWTAHGLPMGMVREAPPVRRNPWETGLFSCLGRQDEFCSSDVEVCFLGAVAPCVLYGGNVERLGTEPGAFTNHCMSYTALYLLGNSFFGWNCLAPWFSYTNRTAIRRRFNLQGTFESLSQSHGCCHGVVEDEMQLEQCETACDFATHVFCHVCSLCQEGREVRRRLPHPGFNASPVLIMVPPGEQTMGR